VQEEHASAKTRPKKIKMDDPLCKGRTAYEKAIEIEAMAAEQTLIVVKPDGFRRRLTGKILARFEEKGFQIRNLKLYNFTKEKAQEFYSVHKEKAFFDELVSFIVSGTVVACILEGSNAVNTVRLMIGATKSFEAAPGTIRGDFGLGFTDNIIHASDSPESFIKESRVIFD
jgi:nucleoside-diphosphate kinase